MITKLLNAFSILPENVGSFTQIKLGKKIRPLLTWLDTKDPRVEIGHRSSFRSSPEFWIYLDKACVGYVTFSYPYARPALVKWFPSNSKFAQPHSTMLPVIQGKGYASFIYEVAIRSGVVLYTWSHTKAAAKLWESLARNTGAKIYQYDVVTRVFVAKPSENSVKVLSLTKPVFRG